MFFQNRNLVAIDIGSSSVKVAEVDLTKRGPVLKKFGITPLPVGAIVGGEIIDFSSVANTVEGLITSSKTKRKFAATALWGNAVIVKKIAMPKMDAALVAEQLRWEAEQYIPFDINEISLEYHIITNSNPGAETMDVLLIAAKQEYIFRFIEVVEAARLKAGLFDVAGFALANCFEVNYGSFDRPVALLNLGAGVTNFVVVDKAEVVFCRDLMTGGGMITSEISKSMNVSLEEAEALKISASFGQEVPGEVHSVISGANEQIVEELKNGFEFYSATASGATITKFFVSGGSVFVPGLVEQISKAVGLPFEPFDPFSRLTYDSKIFTATYIDQIKAVSPVVLGLGLRKLADR
jgi:type IV pilus assembly protein PilM